MDVPRYDWLPGSHLTRDILCFGGIQMYDYYFLRVMMREREREILKDLARGGYHAHRHRTSSGGSKKIVRWFLASFSRLKKMSGPKQSRPEVTDLKGI